MKIVYGKKLDNESTLRVQEIAMKCGVTFDTARLLFYRNQDTVEKAERFLTPSKKGFFNPYLLEDMDRAIDRIRRAVIEDQSVLVFGDYDADGVCASTILYGCLREFGVNRLRVFVPEREDGYGLNVQSVEKLNAEQKIDLLITVDCGISDYDKIQELKKTGIDVIVTDHHEPPEILPDCIRINPKINGQKYPFKELCGAGVAYKLGYALIGEKANAYLDLVALATVADSMDLIEENRDLVSEGLKLFNKESTLRLPFKYLLGENNKSVTAQTLAYVIAPRINAGGRMGDANCSLQLFIQTDPNKIFDYAVKLNAYNVERQVECDEIYRQAKERIKKFALYKNSVITVKDAKWQAGFVGIVAARLVEEFSRPVIVFAGQDDFLKGSARSVDGINIHEAICAVKEHLLGFGGHSQAAGVAVEKDKFSAFDKAINAYVKREYGKVDSTPKIQVEWQMEGPISERFAKEIDLLEPFGTGNRRPLFSVSVGGVKSSPLKAGSPHYSFAVDSFEMLDFNGEKDVFPLSLPIKKQVVFEINVSSFRNKQSIKGYVKAVCPDYEKLSALNLHALDSQLDVLLKDGGNYREIEYSEFKSLPNNSTLFVLSDANNLQRYPDLKNLALDFIRIESKNYSDRIIYAPRELPEGYDRVVYLDTPMQAHQTESESLCIKDACGYNAIKNIRADRSDMIQVFNRLKQLTGRNIDGHADFARQNSENIDEQTFLLGLKVFLELKIFYIKNGILRFDEKVTNALTNSKLYSKIILLKADYV